MTFADTLTVVLEDDTKTDFRNVRYALTRDGLQVDDAGTLHRFAAFNVAQIEARRRPVIA